MKRLGLILCSLLVLSGVYKVCFASEEVDVPPPPSEEARQEYEQEIKKTGAITPIVIAKKADLISIDGIEEPDFGAQQQVLRARLNEYVEAQAFRQPVILAQLYEALNIQSQSQEKQRVTLVKFINAYASRYKIDKTLLFKGVAPKKVELQTGKTKGKQKPVAFFTFYSTYNVNSPTGIKAVEKNTQNTLSSALNKALDELLKSSPDLSNEAAFKTIFTNKIETALKEAKATENTVKIFLASEDFKKLFRDSVEYLKDKSKTEKLEIIVKEESKKPIEEKPIKIKPALPKKPAPLINKNLFPDFAKALDAVKA
ncbi:MAG: hypothetical protein UV38_C0001G0150 [candidate division TM6 bacterium GW2011_GWE2_42_60]|nr:MAG: hypothetical protein UV38_C0001G0150 [candidate division TM6 bacterium GW2011_GWE2_42_60]HBY05654.1 hypothetical protein [Candidatus Dependentiae bacterium]